MQLMFLDESGDHNLSVIDPQYPLFVLGGVIMDAEYVRDVLTPRVQAFKRMLFGNERLVLHTADITRNRNGFERLKDTGFRTEFYRQLNSLMAELDYRVRGIRVGRGHARGVAAQVVVLVQRRRRCDRACGCVRVAARRPAGARARSPPGTAPKSRHASS